MAATQDQKTGKALRIHQSIARDLGMAILSGRIAPGENFGGEIERSEQLGVSRTAYREAVRILAAKGMVESRPKAGTHVTPKKRWNLLDPDILAWMFAGDPQDDFINDLFELRFMVEPGAAFLAAHRRTDEQLATMRAALDAMERHKLSTDEGRAADRQFHDTLVESSGNVALGALASSIGSAVEWTTHFKALRHAQSRDPLPQHRSVFEAIERQDADAAMSAMRQLIRIASEDLADFVERRIM